MFDEMPEMNEKAELAETTAKEPEPMDDSVLSVKSGRWSTALVSRLI